MKLFFLCKRRPQNRDLIERPYGRFYYLPKILAEKGHEVHILLLSNKIDPKISVQKDGIHWVSISLIKHGPWGYLREAEKIVKQVKPDWLGGFSDTYYGILAQRLGAKYNIPSLIDAYDNYESYIPWCSPLHALWRKSLSKASLATAAGPSLADLLGKYRPGKPTEIIPMAADPLFQPMDKLACRKKLGLPLAKKLVGYSGSTMVANRGIDLLFNVFNDLKSTIPDILLVLSGRKGRNITIPRQAHWLGYIPDDHMPFFMNCLDVLVVMNRPSDFGNYSYPVKLYEAMRCSIPVVVSRTLSTEWIMRHNQRMLVEPASPGDLSTTIRTALDHGQADYGTQKNWQVVGGVLAELLLKKAEKCASGHSLLL